MKAAGRGDIERFRNIHSSNFNKRSTSTESLS